MGKAVGYNPEKLFADPQAILAAFRELLDDEPEARLFSWREGGRTKSLNRREFKVAVNKLKNFMVSEGFRRGDRVAILSESRPEWVIAFLASMLGGFVAIPIDIRATSHEVKAILNHAEPSALFVSHDFFEDYRNAQSEFPSLKKVVKLNGTHDNDSVISLKDNKSIPYYQNVQSRLDETAVIVYTSGTSGTPKGVVLTCGNLWFQVSHLSRSFETSRDDVLLSMLPLNHLLELTGGIFTAMLIRAEIVFANSLLPTELIDLMVKHGVTQTVTVPPFLEHIKRGIEREIDRSSAFKQKAFRFAYCLARYVPYKRWRRLLFGQVHEKFGGKLTRFIVGGAALRPELAEFFQRLGISVYQGYGLTETSPVSTVNLPRQNRLGSVGLPLKGVQIKIAEDGEVLIRGPHVMKEYFKDQALTQEVIDSEGWFHSGDLGRLDEDGFLWITGRKKNLIVLPGGKNVAPEEVEVALAESPDFEEVCVLGLENDGRGAQGEAVVAIVRPTINPTRNGSKDWVQKQVSELSQRIAGYKRPSRVIVYGKEFPKTTTRKVKRRVLVQMLTQEGMI